MLCSLRNIYLFIFTQIHVLLYEVFASISILDKGVVSLQKDSVGVQFYIDIENKDRLSGCTINSRTEDCCLIDGEEDCNIMTAYGGYYFVKPKDRETLIFVYPSMYQHDQVGHCDFVLDYRCGGSKRSRRHKVNIPFDTRLYIEGTTNALLEHYLTGSSGSSCDTLDLDSMHECLPVDCEMKYCGERSYFDSNAGKCVDATICESDPENELPDVVYVPSINMCRDLAHPLTVGDIYVISTGMGVLKQPPKQDEPKVEVKSNCSTISQNLMLMRDIMYGKLCPVFKGDVSEYSNCCKAAVSSILMYVGSVCVLFISFLICIQTLAWAYKKFEGGGFKHLCEKFKNIFKSSKCSRKYYEEGVSSDVRNTLLKDVIVSDIPIELRENVASICERMKQQVNKKNRYRSKDIGDQVSLSRAQYDVTASTATSSTSSFEECDDRQKLLK